MKLTNNFTSEEFEKSNVAERYGIDNTVPYYYRENIASLAEQLQIIRDEWNAPIIISSGYRCKELNTKVGGDVNSLHTKGLAVDFSAKDKSKNGDLFKLITSLAKLGKIKLRSIIWEYGTTKSPSWIHIDINGEGCSYRNNQIVYIGVKK